MGSPRPRDSQRSRVYSWENTIIDAPLRNRLTLSECTALVERALQCYQPGMPVPLVVDGRNGKRAWVNIVRNKISLPIWARTPCVVLHDNLI
jgi:hypothetical protein